MINLFSLIISIFIFIGIFIWVKHFFKRTIFKSKYKIKEVRRSQLLSSVFVDLSNRNKHD